MGYLCLLSLLASISYDILSTGLRFTCYMLMTVKNTESIFLEVIISVTHDAAQHGHQFMPGLCCCLPVTRLLLQHKQFDLAGNN